jgi:hypothetical protein
METDAANSIANTITLPTLEQQQIEALKNFNPLANGTMVASNSFSFADMVSVPGLTLCNVDVDENGIRTGGFTCSNPNEPVLGLSWAVTSDNNGLLMSPGATIHVGIGVGVGSWGCNAYIDLGAKMGGSASCNLLDH